MEISLFLGCFFSPLFLTTVELNAPHLLNSGLSCGIEWSVRSFLRTLKHTGKQDSLLIMSITVISLSMPFIPLLYPDFKTTLIRMNVAEHPEFLGN